MAFYTPIDKTRLDSAERGKKEVAVNINASSCNEMPSNAWLD